MGNPITSQLVGDEPQWLFSLTLQESLKESLCRKPVPTRLHQDVNDVAVLIDGTPEVLQLAVDSDEHFVQIPRIAEPTLASFESPGILGAEFDRPLSDRFVRHDHSTLCEQILDIPET